MKQINAKYAALGGETGFLGAATAPATLCPDQAGWFRHYKGGSIYWHPDTAAHVVYGEIFKHWASLGWENSWLGYPVSDEEAHANGRRSRFQNGVITWDAASGVRNLEGVGCSVHYRSTRESFNKQCVEQPAKGRRLIALSIFGTLIDPRFAAVWTSHPGPEQRIARGLSQDDFEDWQAKNKTEGFHTTLLAVNQLALPPVKTLLFAAVAEPASGDVPFSRFDLRLDGPATDDKSLSRWTKWAFEEQYIPSSLDLYEVAGEVRAAIVLTPNPGRIVWNCSTLVGDGKQRKRYYDLYTSHGARPALVTRLVADRRLTLYREDAVGFWTSLSQQTESEVSASTDQAAREGRYPISLTGDATGRFTAIWASRKDPLPNRWAIVGKEVPELANVDAAMRAYLQANNIRCASAAVGKDGRLVYARTFTWAPPTYPIATPQHIFRVGSCTKVFNAIVAHQLIDEARTDPGTGTPIGLASGMLKTLGVTTSLASTGALAPGTTNITLAQLLSHTNGLADQNTNWDRQLIADATGKKYKDSTKKDCVRHLVGYPLKTPDYTNNGYVAVGAVIEAVDTINGQRRSAFESIRARVLAPLGLTRPAVSGWALSKSIPWSVHQHTLMVDVFADVMENDGSDTRSGYQDYNPSHGEGCGSLAFSAADVVKVMTSFTCGQSKNPLLTPAAIARMWPASGPTRGFLTRNPPSGFDGCYWHNGAVGGGHAEFFIYRNDNGNGGVVTAHIFNKDGNGAAMPNWDMLVAGVTTWPTHDLFEGVGIPPHEA